MSESTSDELRDEAEELVKRLVGRGMPRKDFDFVKAMAERFQRYGERTKVTRRQVFWLRGIAERVDS